MPELRCIIYLAFLVLGSNFAYADGCGRTAAPMVLPAGMGVDDITVFRGRDEVSWLRTRIWFEYRPDIPASNEDWGYTPGDRSTIHPALNFVGKQSAYSSGIAGASVIVDVGGSWGTGQGGFREMARSDIEMSESEGTIKAIFYTSCTDPYPNTTVTVSFSCHVCNQVNTAPQRNTTFASEVISFHSKYDVREHILRNFGDHWSEFIDGKVAFNFNEYLRNNNYIYIEDKSRNLSLALPIKGGQGLISFDRKHWQDVLFALKLF